jgi:hypothetical protein
MTMVITEHGLNIIDKWPLVVVLQVFIKLSFKYEC